MLVFSLGLLDHFLVMVDVIITTNLYFTVMIKSHHFLKYFFKYIYV